MNKCQRIILIATAVAILAVYFTAPKYMRDTKGNGKVNCRAVEKRYAESTKKIGMLESHLAIAKRERSMPDVAMRSGVVLCIAGLLWLSVGKLRTHKSTGGV